MADGEEEATGVPGWWREEHPQEKLCIPAPASGFLVVRSQEIRLGMLHATTVASHLGLEPCVSALRR
jgi:hypothetical protein